MSNLPQALREELSQTFTIPCVKIEKKLVSSLDNTVKYLYGLPDGETVESVLMEYKHGWSQCLSTQVGCRMGCSFCATGMGGFVRNLLPSEMLAQIERAQTDNGIRVSSVVLMGMGEPLDNYDNVLRFLKMLAEDGGVHIGMRHVSLSTCGLVDKMYQLMEEKLQLTLSISLHAPNDDIRSRLMPVNHRWPVEELLKACRAYIQATSRRISFEYAMIQGVNDSDACAHGAGRSPEGHALPRQSHTGQRSGGQEPSAQFSGAAARFLRGAGKARRQRDGAAHPGRGYQRLLRAAAPPAGNRGLTAVTFQEGRQAYYGVFRRGLPPGGTDGNT